MGLKKISLYDGGWYEWSNVNNGTSFVETGLPKPTTEWDGQSTTIVDSTSGISDHDTTENDKKNNSINLNFNFLLIVLLKVVFMFSIYY